MKFISLVALLLLLGLKAHPQPIENNVEAELLRINQTRVSITQTGMFVLGSWALLNIAGGTFTSTQSSGSRRYFLQGNALWNTVNLGLAGYSLYTLGHTDVSSLTLAESVQEQYKIEKLLLFNAGLDVAYILGGIGMKSYAPRSKNADLFIGYGHALMVQGAFLLLFDFTLFTVLHKHGVNELLPLLEHLSPASSGIGMAYRF